MTPLARSLADMFSIQGWLDDLNYWESPVFERLVVVDARSIVESERVASELTKPANGSRRLPVED